MLEKQGMQGYFPQVQGIMEVITNCLSDMTRPLDTAAVANILLGIKSVRSEDPLVVAILQITSTD